MRTWRDRLTVGALLLICAGAYGGLAARSWSQAQPTAQSVFWTQSEDDVLRPDGSRGPVVVRIECDGERAQVFVDDRLEGERERVEWIVQSDRFGLGGATFATWRLDPERVRQACAIH